MLNMFSSQRGGITHSCWSLSKSVCWLSIMKILAFWVVDFIGGQRREKPQSSCQSVFLQNGEVLPLKIVTYTTVSISLAALLITFILLVLIRTLRSNLHSIHKNLVAALFFSELVFLIGINQTENPVRLTLCSLLELFSSFKSGVHIAAFTSFHLFHFLLFLASTLTWKTSDFLVYSCVADNINSNGRQ